MPGSNESPPRPSLVACLACRRRHVKCDALMPTCTRCQTTLTECQYVRSKRGLRKRTRESSCKAGGGTEAFIAIDSFSDWLDTIDIPSDIELDTIKVSLDATIEDFNDYEDGTVSLPKTEPVSPDVAYDPMIQLYYQNFHRSHPVMVPRKALDSICYIAPSHIFSIMRYIGAHYYPNTTLKEKYRQAAFACLSDPTMHEGFQVQAVLLLAIVEHADCHEQSAHQLIQAAASIALDIGLNKSSYAMDNSFGHAVLEESWRRTYWELYVVDGLMAAMGQQRPFHLYKEPVNMPLPCAEDMYTVERIIPTGKTLQDLQTDWTLGQEFSAFAYRISAVQELGRVLELNRSLEDISDPQIETNDAHLTSSLRALPPLHADGYDSSCHDEMVFQAQMILYLALIYLHHPHSGMRFASYRISPPTSCTLLKATERPESHITPSQTLDLHSHKLLRAADLLSGLATLPSAIHQRSSFFTCALAMCIVVHTAALLVVAGSGKEESLKTRIQLSIGGLKALGKTWPLSEAIRQQMVEMYHEVVRK
ncbi:Zn(II)2Cys6 transcription factor [Aspergillus stella-maris]|uniref:Zn(II)2Cys6 transcription factor n=1 Tax=Aspergillus stella-maris TaxID=1810926 RepID=UPI003CCE0331